MPEENTVTKKKSLKLIAGLIVLLVIASVVSLIASNNASKNASSAAKTVTPPLAFINVSDSSFSPATLTIKKGTVVVWRAENTNTKTVIVASNPFPKDNGLKSLKSAQIGAGASYRYQFDTVGTFSYHDDLNPTTNGTVVVK